VTRRRIATVRESVMRQAGEAKWKRIFDRQWPILYAAMLASEVDDPKRSHLHHSNHTDRKKERGAIKSVVAKLAHQTESLQI
jgi:hypothetical protein